MMKRWMHGPLRLLLLAAVVAGLAFAGRHLIARKKSRLASAPRRGVGPLAVRTAVARRGRLVRQRGFLAVVEPVRAASVAARVTARVEQVLHDEGDEVNAGEALVILDGRERRAEIAAVAARIEQARADLAANRASVLSLEHSAAYWAREAERDKTLADKGDMAGSRAEATADKASELRSTLKATRQKTDAIRHRIEFLRSRRDQLAIQLTYCTLKSPYAGPVTRRLVDPGDLASPGRTLIVVEDRSALKLAFDVPQQDLSAVRAGLRVAFSVGADSRSARLSRLFPALDPARMVRAEVDLVGPVAQGLTCGAYVPLTVTLSRRDGVTLVPRAAVCESRNRDPHVFVVRGDRLEARPITVLGYSGSEAAVAGVAPGERVVVTTFLGWARLAAGRRVDVLP